MPKPPAKPHKVITGKGIRSYETKEAAQAAAKRLAGKGTAGYLRHPGQKDIKF